MIYPVQPSPLPSQVANFVRRMGRFLRHCTPMKEKWKSEKGEVNMVAIVLIILVVLALVVIFRDSLTRLLKTLFEKIENEALAI